MVFQGPDPYGTPGGDDAFSDAGALPDVRLAIGKSHITYLLVNGPLTVRNRYAIEQIVRTLNNNTPEGTVAVIIRDDTAIIDNNTTDIDFRSGLKVTQVSPGVTFVEIPAKGISNSMLADAIINTIKVADGAITPEKLSAAYALVNHSHTPNVSSQVAIGARTISSNQTDVAHTNITLPAIPTVCKVRAFLRVESIAGDGGPTNGTINVAVANNAGISLPFQSDGGVDSLLVAVNSYTTSGGTTLGVGLNFTINFGSLSVKGGYYDYDCYPIR